MSGNYPTISVVLPVFNSVKYISESIRSILNQTYSNFEFIIIDDHSTDGTVEKIQSFSDDRIVILYNEHNLGIVETLNKGFAQCKGEYIARMDGDDWSVPERFEKQLNFLIKNPSYGICGCWVQPFSDTGNVLAIWEYPETNEEIQDILPFKPVFAHPAVMLRRNILNKYNLFYDNRFVAAEDYAFWRELCMVTQAYNYPKVLLHYRIHNKQITNVLGEKQRKTVFWVRMKFILEIIGSIPIDELIVIENFFNYIDEKRLISLNEFKNIVHVLDSISLNFAMNSQRGHHWCMRALLLISFQATHHRLKGWRIFSSSKIFSSIPLKDKIKTTIRFLIKYKN